MKRSLLSIFLTLMFAFAGFGQSYSETDLGVIAQVNNLDIEVQLDRKSVV